VSINPGMMSSATPEWATPQNLFDDLNAEFGPFDLDPCATSDNAKCERFFTKDQDGLAQKWSGRVFMNPPYGRGIGAWMKKAQDSASGGAIVVCLVPARTCSAWWHDYAMKGEVRFVRGRIKFGGHKWNAPFPSAIVIFRPRTQ
jgi:phage N-6-adenine-methyltransferase